LHNNGFYLYLLWRVGAPLTGSSCQLCMILWMAPTVATCSFNGCGWICLRSYYHHKEFALLGTQKFLWCSRMSSSTLIFSSSVVWSIRQ
jgi:hypothetical protein